MHLGKKSSYVRTYPLFKTEKNNFLGFEQPFFITACFKFSMTATNAMVVNDHIYHC